MHYARGNVAVDVVDDPLADYPPVVDDDWRRRTDLIRRFRRTYVGAQVDRAVIGEAETRLTGVGVERDQPSFEHRGEYVMRARLSRRRLDIGDTAADELVVALDRCVLVPAPFGLAGRRVNRLNERVWRTGVEHVTDVDRRRFRMILALAFLCPSSDGQVAGVLRPRQLEVGNILRRDVGKDRIAPSRVRSAVVMPVTVGRRLS